ncbi:MAG: TolC family protein [Planctomycetota bacterium]|nr:TolC family protein [Planctomycetota bacterium]
MLSAVGLLSVLAPFLEEPQVPAQQPVATQPVATQPTDRPAGQGTVRPGEVAQDPDRLLGPDRALELTLDGAYELALKRNIQLQLAATDAQIAVYRARGSWGAFDWVVGARLGYSDAEFQPQNVFGGGSETNEEYSLNLTKPLSTGGTFQFGFDSTRSDTNSGFNVTPQATTDVVSLSYVQPLLRNGWSDYATSTQKLSELQAQRSDQALRSARQQLLLDVANAYWDLVAARELLDVAEKSLALSQAQVDQNRRRLDAGLGTEVEVLQAQADVAVREEQRLLREFDVRTSADALRKLLFPGTDVALWDTALVPGTPLPTEARADGVPAWPVAMQTAISRRPELREQRSRIDEAEVRHQQTLSEKKPQLDLDLSANGQGFSTSDGDALDTAFGYDFPTYRASLVFGVPIGNTTAKYAEKAAWAEIRRARLTYDELETSVVADVRAAVRNVLYAVESVRATRKSLEFAQRQLAAEQARFAVDQSTTFQVLQYQTDLASAMSNERRARVAFARNLVRLQAAQGVLGDDLGS